MRALQYKTYGTPDVLEVNDAASKPAVEPGKILIEIYAASPNRFDSKLREGSMKEMMPLTFPATIGGDFSGVISQIGDGVTGFSVGDQIYGQALIINGGSGSVAEFATTKAKYVAKKPKTLNFIESASLTLVGVSALQAIEEHIKLRSGQKILITGGAGGIGSIAIQIAKMHGAYVATTVAKKDEEFAGNLGADLVLDYKTQDPTEMLKEYDAVFDTAGGGGSKKLFSVIKKGGIFVSMVGAPDDAMAKEYGVTTIAQSTHIRTENLTRLADLVDEGKVRPEIEKIFPFKKGREAFEYFETAHPRGKIVIAIGE